MKYSKNFNRDYEFYLRHKDRFQFHGGTLVKLVEHDPNGPSPKKAFHIYESNGILDTCNDVETLNKLIYVKKGINFHIKMWAEGYDDCLQGIHEYMSEFIDPPSWVEKALRNQIAINYFKRRGQ